MLFMCFAISDPQSAENILERVRLQIREAEFRAILTLLEVDAKHRELQKTPVRPSWLEGGPSERRIHNQRAFQDKKSSSNL